MARSSPPADTSGLDVPWRTLERQLEDLQERATRDDFETFYRALLERLVQATAAAAAFVWGAERHPQSPESWHLRLRWGCDLEERFPDDCSESALRQRLVEQIGDSVPFVPSGNARPAPDELPASLALGIGNGERATAALQVVWDQTLPASTLHAHHKLLQAFAEIAGEFARHEEMRALEAGREEDVIVEQFSLAVQAASSPAAVWYTATHEIARLVPADRVSLLTAEGGWRVRSISHVDSPDRRSPVVRSMERLAAAAGTESEPQWLQSTAAVDNTLAQEPHWQRHLEETAARAAAFLPLLGPAPAGNFHGPQVLGGLLLERLHETPFTPAEQRRLTRLSQHVTAALVRLSRQRANSVTGMLRKGAFWGGAFLIAGMVAAAFMPVTFTIPARGALQPELRRDVFAPSDGVVRSLSVREGDHIAAEAPLLELTNDDIELELTKVAGELHTARQQLLSVQAARLDASATNPAREQRSQLAAEEERLKQVLQNLEAQQEHLQERREKLVVRSPIAGRIVTANLEESLRSRPLRRGQRLLTVADEDQAWLLELWVEDADVGHVLAARQKNREIPLEFVVATEPTHRHQASVTEISEWTELRPEGPPAVRVRARIATPEKVALRAGATVTAKLDCGRRPLGYVFFRDLIELVYFHFSW